MKTQRILGLDIGDRYIGIAISDPLGLLAHPYKTYERATQEDDILFFQDLIDQYDIKTLVCGLPYNLDGTESAQTRKARNYAGFLKNHTTVEELKFVDETLTTIEAEEILDDNLVKKGRSRKSKIDTIAAQIILQNFLDEVKSETERNDND